VRNGRWERRDARGISDCLSTNPAALEPNEPSKGENQGYDIPKKLWKISDSHVILGAYMASYHTSNHDTLRHTTLVRYTPPTLLAEGRLDLAYSTVEAHLKKVERRLLNHIMNES